MNDGNGNSKGMSGLVIGLIVGGVALALVCCGGVGFFAYRAAQTTLDAGGGLLEAGTAMLEDQVKADIVDHPIIVEHIGTITSFTQDFSASMNEPGEEVFVYDVVGTKGSGRLRAEHITIDADTEDVVAGELTMSTGEKYQLFPDNPLE